jgi:hypothetical protein
VNRFKLILGFLAFLLIANLAGIVFGKDAKIYFLVFSVFVSIILSFLALILKRRMDDQARGSGRRDAHDMAKLEPECDDIVPLPGPRLHGYRRCIDGIIALVTLFGPPILVSVYRGERLSWDSPLTGYHVLASGTGVAFYYLTRSWIWRS